MHWKCPTPGCEYVYNVGISEPMNKPIYCNGCGKTQVMVPGTLSEEDLMMLDSIRSNLLAEQEEIDDFI